MVGGGAASFDCNGDGFEDLWLAGGEGKSKLFVNRSARGGDLRFEESKSGAEFDATTGAYPIDIDGDGIKDLVVLRVGESVALRGLGGCKFERANEAWGFTGGDAWWTSFSATWEKGLNWPTLALGAYVDRNVDTYPWGTCTDNWLLRPETDGKRFAKPLALKPSFCCPLSILFTDWNRSARRRCAFPTTANITKAARSRCGRSLPVSRPSSTRRTKVGNICASGAWASPATISIPTAIPNIS